MMVRRPTAKVLIVYVFLLMLSFVMLLAACGSNEGSPDDKLPDTGSISFDLTWKSTAIQPTFEPSQSPGGDVCADYAIDTVDVTVADASNKTVASESWPCSAHQGTITDVPTGTGMALTIGGTVGGKVHWRQQIKGITVSSGKTTRVGKVVMNYVGDDSTPPNVASHYPADNATSVIRNPVITATFTENVVVASVNALSCALADNTTKNKVSCTVSYDPVTKTASISPDALLDANSDYSVSISTDVEDLASHHMTSNVEWIFTTGTHTAETLVWGSSNWDESVWN